MFFAWKCFADVPESCLWCSSNHPRVWVHVALECLTSPCDVNCYLSTSFCDWYLFMVVCANKSNSIPLAGKTDYLNSLSVVFLRGKGGTRSSTIVFLPKGKYIKYSNFLLFKHFAKVQKWFIFKQLFFCRVLSPQCFNLPFLIPGLYFIWSEKSDHQYRILVLRGTFEVTLSNLTWFNWSPRGLPKVKWTHKVRARPTGQASLLQASALPSNPAHWVALNSCSPEGQSYLGLLVVFFPIMTY